jgi:predicted transcriptional regulator
MPQTSILVHLNPEIQARLVAMAVDRKQPIHDVAAEIVSLYFAPDTWEDEQVRASLAELEAGHGISDEHMTEWLASLGTEIELHSGKTRRP